MIDSNGKEIAHVCRWGPGKLSLFCWAPAYFNEYTSITSEDLPNILRDGITVPGGMHGFQWLHSLPNGSQTHAGRRLYSPSLPLGPNFKLFDTSTKFKVEVGRVPSWGQSSYDLNLIGESSTHDWTVWTDSRSQMTIGTNNECDALVFSSLLRK